MLNKYKDFKSRQKEKTTTHVKKRRYFKILFSNFMLFFFVGELVDVFSVLIQSNWGFYFLWSRLFESLAFYIVGAVVFTILIVKKYSIKNKEINPDINT